MLFIIRQLSLFPLLFVPIIISYLIGTDNTLFKKLIESFPFHSNNKNNKNLLIRRAFNSQFCTFLLLTELISQLDTIM